MKTIACLFLFCCFLLVCALARATTSEPALLFYLSADHEFVADYAAGDPKPTFLRDVQVIKDGARGAAGGRVRDRGRRGRLLERAVG